MGSDASSSYYNGTAQSHSSCCFYVRCQIILDQCVVVKCYNVIIIMCSIAVIVIGWHATKKTKLIKTQPLHYYEEDWINERDTFYKLKILTNDGMNLTYKYFVFH